MGCQGLGLYGIEFLGGDFQGLSFWCFDLSGGRLTKGRFVQLFLLNQDFQMKIF